MYGRGQGRGRKREYGSGRGYGIGYGMGLGRGRYTGRGNPLPYCRWNPSLPRGWWRDPNFQQNLGNINFPQPRPYVNNDAIDYQIELIEDQIKFLEKEIDRLKSLKKRY